ncbi:Dihydroorotase [Candidatus Bartonella washoeensis]|uniref:Dihydroorotase, multifunctional complex type n=1 Tax=Candidatus Bartonella washoeensis Sb944nv TaxID=1094563 RepID=J1J2S0_9HYPH|nr:dihydroorotase [Bartonella washoeensis]EJF77935.1 dihydroorotase, multifunctional complex type [Bartonella washoeensis Sb944nv]SPU27597.1 Dihydroorotase [Bartonella washoeensis]
MIKPIVFQNARIIDPSRVIDEIGTVIVENGLISAAGKEALNQGIPEGAEIINAQNKAILPGLVDARVFVGEPGNEYRETIASASQSAAAGGITSFLMMPDTNPVIDNVALVKFITHTAQEISSVNIYPVAAITQGFHGQEITEFGLLKDAGVIAFSEGKKTLQSSSVMRRAMTYARDFNVTLMHETQDADLTGQGVMNEGLLASWLGLSGIPREAEVIPLERDLRLAALTKTRYHAAQISTALSADALRLGKQRNANISAGVSINHLSFNENDIGEYRTSFRLMPPLRTEEDRTAMIEAIKDGTVDIIVSSHDPQSTDRKHLPFNDAAAGAIGMETLLSAALRLYHNESISLLRLTELLSTAPAKIFGIDAGTLRKGAYADLILIDLDEPWVVSTEKLYSRSKNTPFENARFQGRVLQTFVKGQSIFKLDQ